MSDHKNIEELKVRKEADLSAEVTALTEAEVHALETHAKPKHADESSKHIPLTAEEKRSLEAYLEESHFTVKNYGDGQLNSAGAKLFNVGVYKGVGFAGAAALSISLTDMFQNGWLKKSFDKAAGHVAPIIGKLRGLHGERATTAAHSFLIFAGLFSGGTLLLYPIQQAEKYKLTIVQWLDKQWNKMFPPSKMDLKIQEDTHEKIKHEAKPDLKYLMLGRLIATLTVFSTVFALGGKDKETTDFLAKKTSEAFSKSSNETLNSLGKSERFGKILSIGYIDMFLTLIAEETLYLTTRIYKGMHFKKRLASLEAEEAKKQAEAPGGKPAPMASNDNFQSLRDEPKATIAPEVIANNSMFSPHLGQPMLGGAT